MLVIGCWLFNTFVFDIINIEAPSFEVILGKPSKKKTAIIVTLSLSHFTPTLPKEIGTVIIGTKST